MVNLTSLKIEMIFETLDKLTANLDYQTITSFFTGINFKSHCFEDATSMNQWNTDVRAIDTLVKETM